MASEVPARFESFKAVKGRFPQSAGEVAIDEATAERASLKLGERMIVAGSAPARPYTIVGITRFGGGASFGGAGAAILTAAEAQRVVGEPGRYDEIDVAAAPGTSATQLRDRLRAALPATRRSSAPAPSRPRRTPRTWKATSRFIRTFLLVFAYVSLFVGAFIIFNTFSITVAQRTREFGLLRTLGASRAAGDALGDPRKRAARGGRGAARAAGRAAAGAGARSAVQVVRGRPPGQRDRPATRARSSSPWPSASR